MNENEKLISDQTLEKIRDRVVNAAKRNSPSHIKNITGTIVNKEGKVSVLFQVPNKPPQEDARAQELGSGLYGKNFKSPKQTHPKGKIVIKPKNAQFLAFYWQRNKTTGEAVDMQALMRGRKKETRYTAKFFGRGRFNGKLLFNWVEHPGIKPYNGKGYLKPAFDETKEENKRDLLDSGVNAIRLTLRRNFSHLGKK